jgi:hypothetical protein
MTAIRSQTIQRAFPRVNRFVCVLITVLLLSPRAESAVLPLGDEQDSWSDLLLPSANGTFDTVGRTLTIGTGSTAVSADLEIGSQFGPSNPGWHYGTTGTLGGTFSVGLGITRLHVSPTGVVTDSDSIVTLSYDSGATGSLGTDYGIGRGRSLLRGVATEVFIDAAGEDTLDITFRITPGSDLQELPNQQAPLLGKFAPGNLALIRITAPNLPSNWTSNFNFTATSLHAFGLVPEQGALLLVLAACPFSALLRPRRSRRPMGKLCESH